MSFKPALILLLLLSRSSLAAPCCAGNAAAPALISGDDSAQLTATVSRASVIGDVSDAGRAVFRSASDSEVTQVIRLDGALLVTDRLQTGVSIPLVRRGVDKPALSSSATRVGDVRVDTAYEFLPEWIYSEWKPKGYVFIQATLATGRSIYEAQAPGSVDAVGRGWHSLSVGTLLVKRWSLWDAVVIPEVHYSLARGFTDSLGEPFTVHPGWGASAALGVGISPGGGSYRVGLGLQPSYGQPKKIVSANGDARTSQTLVWGTSLDATWLLSAAWSMNANYTDETLLGPAMNSSLSRTVALGLQHRWER